MKYEVEPFGVVEIIVEGDAVAEQAMAILLKRSASFAVMPLPDGYYRFTVKPESVPVLEHLEAKLPDGDAA